MWIISLPYALTDDSINIWYKLFIYSNGVYTLSSVLFYCFLFGVYSLFCVCF